MYTGLNNEEVAASRKKYGTNAISNKKKNSFFKLFIETLADPIIKILLIALAIKTIFLFHDFDWFETIGIVIAILVASLISSISEYGSESAFERLQEESSKINCKVKRNNSIQSLSIDDIVVGDIVLLQSGDKIPADGLIVSGEIDVDESSLNGEAIEVTKIGNLDNKVYRGTVVYSKEALMQVKAVGNNTYYGKMTEELQETSPDSPLKLRLRKLAETISTIGYISAALVSFSYLFSEIVVQNNFQLPAILNTITNIPLMFKYILYTLTLSVTIIVVAVPEGLPMMITLVLSSNMKKMLKSNVLVRKLVGIETAGSLNILFTDKTGTLTKGELEVVSFITGTGKEFISEKELPQNSQYVNYLKYACIYNNSSYYDDNHKPVGGNITDRAILEFIKTPLQKNIKKLKTTPFDSTKKYSSTILDLQEPTNFIKGAPDKILPLCTSYLTLDGKKRTLLAKDDIMNDIKRKTSNGIRAILLAYNDNYHYEELNRLTLIAILYLKDEVRKEAIEGLELVKKAGVQVVMITGDSKETALSIAKEMRLVTSDKDIVLTHQELENLSDENLKEMLPDLRIVARSLPQDKSRLVKISEELNLVTGMTGDGVNDAPALKKADVGFSMGGGSEVCKEASDIVILDDNFLSISNAILFGRTIFKSIRKFIIFQLTINLCAVSLSIIGPFIGIETPVTIVQMLWINMIMDTLAGIAFSYEPPLKSYMNEPPKKKEEPIINKYMYGEILFTGIYSSILCLIFLTSSTIRSFYRYDPTDKYFMTAFFALFIFMGIFNSFNARTTRINILSNIFKNKAFLIVTLIIVIVQLYLIYYGGELFRAFGLTLKEIQITILLAATVIPIDWIRKLIVKRTHSSI
ncbi:MAG: calcium-translocating P-type ATPase, PMCA-type [Tenericutes bacterium]|nr:calcium-translocating P-type ATPase, PMCA-type [Mycoplasmatota bacterium]